MVETVVWSGTGVELVVGLGSDGDSHRSETVVETVVGSGTVLVRPTDSAQTHSSNTLLQSLRHFILSLTHIMTHIPL